MRNAADFNDFLDNEVNINQSRLDRLHRSERAVTEYLSKNLDSFLGVERQGSNALRTIIKPVGDRDDYDLDNLVFIEYDSAKEPEGYIDAVYYCLKQNHNYADKVHRRTRCVYIDYAGDFSMDLVPCVKVNGSHRICNNKTNEFEPTDGTGYRDWFNAKSQITHGNLKRVVRLMKYLRDHKGNFTAQSILLTTLIGNSVKESDDPANFRNVPDTLRIVTNRINDYLQANQFMPEIRNPVLPGETFTRHWDQNKYRNFREKFAIYTRKINDAYNEPDSQKSVKQWQDLFGDGFGRSGSSNTVNRGTAPQGGQRQRQQGTQNVGPGVAPVTSLPPKSVTPRKPYAR